ncbi:protein-glutamate O-methyltransferase CheR [Bremerella cremea]|uniref:protein-glutamate O-methyltransferase n=1 Tax=Bremerella cremea TaxID=1031537 RepID=A0A368KXN9_9BACT|nr:protein-glutamate O-methyltransferase CheR [Bremerella cremea]RCS56028.1 protein-glutamate O-methyltransferase CheR [Bremerella cremea]
MSHLSATSQVTDDQMRRYAKMIYEVAGIEISPAKKQLLSNRIRRRLKQTGIADFEEYFKFLSKLPTSHEEWDGFLQEVTTHETYLFRDESNWKWLRGEFIPEIQKSGKNSLRVWSAACSTGDEAYTIACCLAEDIRNLSAWRIQILGSDIGIGAVREAQEARFGERSMRLVPESLKNRHFKRVGDVNVWEPNAKLRAMTSFRQHNLLDRLSGAPFDLVFLKNVLIYFNVDSKKRVMKNIEQTMKPGGFLVAGAAEGIGDLMGAFQRIHPWLYQKK